MRWTPGGESEDVEDRRSEGGGGFGGSGIGGRHVGIGGLIVLGLLSLVFKRDLITPFLGISQDSAVATSAPDPARDASEQKLVQFVSFVLDDNQKTWNQILTTAGRPYEKTKLVLFRDATESGCGTAESATGPFYCPADEKVYIDLAFYEELKRRFGAPGEFAQAYVIAHEIGHHIQKLLGVEAQVRKLQDRNPGQANPLSVKTELQADCFAGVWAHTTGERNLLEAGDVESALGAAAAVGDDHIQKMARGRVSPETFTHGSSEQRMKWFQAGYKSGQVQACDTFAAGN